MAERNPFGLTGLLIEDAADAFDQWQRNNRNALRMDKAMRDARYREATGQGGGLTSLDWEMAQNAQPAESRSMASGRMPEGFTLIPRGQVPGPDNSPAIAAALPEGFTLIPRGNLPAVNKVKAAQELAGGKDSIFPITGLPRFLTEMGLRLASSRNPNFLSALSESALTGLQATEAVEDKVAARKLATRQLARQEALMQAQVNQLNASALEAMDKVGKPRDIKIGSTMDGVMIVLKDGVPHIATDPRTGKPMMANDPETTKIITGMIEQGYELDEILQQLGSLKDIRKQLGDAGSALIEPQSSGTVKGTKSSPNRTPGGYTVRVTPNK